MSDEKELVVLPRQGSAVIEHYPANSGEFIPGLELTLAKRILRPGSNRVVCLAARTSVPFNDNDELASVSDVALKLPDGTNVRLSVSMFNDLADTGYAPFKRYIYDPNRYANQSDPKVFALFLAMLLVSWAALNSLSTESLRRAQWAALLHAYHSHIQSSPSAINPIKALVRSSDAKDKTTIFKPNSLKAKEESKSGAFPRTNAVVNTNKDLKAKVSHVETRAVKAKSLMHESMLVPPPPPLPYNLSERNMFFPYDPAQLVKPAVVSVKPISQTRMPVNNQSLPRNVISKPIEETPLSLSGKGASQLESISTSSSAHSSGAPLPGAASCLERIIPPAESVFR